MPTVFVSYRRKDSDAIAGRIAARLRTSFGKSAVFLDVSSIPVAAQFAAHIAEAMRGCRIVVAVIGPDWRGPGGEAPSRIHSAEDFVRREIELAASSGAELFPVLVGGAAMPTKETLPASLGLICERNAAPVDAGADFDHHMRRLIRAIDRALVAGMRWRIRAVSIALGALAAAILVLGLGHVAGGLPRLALIGGLAAGLGLVLAYAGSHRMLVVDLPHRLALPLGVALAAAVFAMFWLPPMLLHRAPLALGSQQEVLASVKELHDEFARARAALERSGGADFSGAEAIAVSLSQLDPENGHALYYRAEIERVQAGAHFTAESCPKPLARGAASGLDIYRKQFYEYLEVEKTLAESEAGGGAEWQLCYQRTKGYCLQRTAWINHLLANDLYQEALAANDGETRLATLERARGYAGAALKFHPAGQPAGFVQCTDTQVLLKKIADNLNARPAN